MNVHEYQAKELLRAFDVATPDGQLATTPEEAEKAAKAQAFANAIESEETAPFTMDPAAIAVDEAYSGPRIDESGTLTVRPSLLPAVATHTKRRGERRWMLRPFLS